MVYRVEAMDIVRFIWNNDISGKLNSRKYHGIYFMGLGTLVVLPYDDIHSYMGSYVELNKIPINTRAISQINY